MSPFAAPSSTASILLALAILVTPGPVPALDASPVVYELREGSLITDDCLDCERPTIQDQLIGTFTLTRVESPLDFDRYEVTDVAIRSRFRDPGARYDVGGSGTYSINTREGNQEMVLDLDVNGVSGIRLASGAVPVCPPCEEGGLSWPALEITVTEDGSRDPLHVFTIRIVAAPQPKEIVQYELVEGSSVTIDCFVCELVNPTQPIRGFFALGRISEDASPVATYRLDDLSFQNGDGSLQGTGLGLYTQGGEVAVLQSMEIEASLNGDPPVLLTSGEVPATAPLPAIAINVRGSRSPAGGPIFLQSLLLVARPVETAPLPFRRGDANADGETNISDPVFILLWRFSDGDEPSCLDAADTNDDEKHDITDPIFLLLFLFQGGTTPPAPGPESCETGTTPSSGCSAYPSC